MLRSIMQLERWCDKEKGRAARLARALNVRPVMVAQWISGAKTVPFDRAVEIERATFGAVRADELRPDYADLYEYLRNTK